jgi:hypothetical protein
MVQTNHQVFAACTSGNLSQLNKYLRDGGNPNLTDDNKHSLLMLASQHGHLQLASALLAAGADLDYYVDLGMLEANAVTFAAKNNHLPVLRKLHSAAPGCGVDADVAAPALEGHREAARVAWEEIGLGRMEGNNPVLMSLFWLPDATEERVARGMRILLDLGGDRFVNHRDRDRTSALMKAAAAGYPSVARMLLAAGAKPKYIDKYGHSAVLYSLRDAATLRVLRGWTPTPPCTPTPGAWPPRCSSAHSKPTAPTRRRSCSRSGPTSTP